MSRVKTVYHSSEIAHLWANQSVSYARNPQSNFYFEKSRIFSYGGHFLAAKLINENTVVINSRSYSNTTAGHLHQIRYALDYNQFTNRFEVPETDIAIGKYKGHHRTNIEHYFSEIKHLSKLVQTARSRKVEYLQSIDRLKATVLRYCKVFKCKGLLTYAHKAILNASNDELNEKYHKLHLAKLRKEKIEHKKAMERQKVRFAEDSAKFLNFEISTIYSGEKVLLRLKDDVIQTSLGVEVPKQRCIELWPLIHRCKSKQTEWIENGENFRIGHYRINKIDMFGNVKAGCHYLTYDVLKDMAKQLELI
jgi:hypothetical protein